MSDIANDDRYACNDRQMFQRKEMPLHQQDGRNAMQTMQGQGSIQ